MKGPLRIYEIKKFLPLKYMKNCPKKEIFSLKFGHTKDILLYLYAKIIPSRMKTKKISEETKQNTNCMYQKMLTSSEVVFHLDTSTRVYTAFGDIGGKFNFLEHWKYIWNSVSSQWKFFITRIAPESEFSRNRYVLTVVIFFQLTPNLTKKCMNTSIWMVSLHND